MTSRRTLVKAGLLTAASYSRVRGANERVVMGLIGCGGRGRYVARFMKEDKNMSFAAVCDAYEPNAAAARTWAGADATSHREYRQLLERKDLDAVLVATPDHWHALPTIDACQAGKHVYVEKPLAHNIREQQAMVAAAKRTGRIVQTGTQQRTAPHYREAQQIVQSGELGEVRFVRVWNFTNMTPHGIGKEPDGPVPAGLDWELYQGAAPMRPFNPLRLGPTYRWFWDYAGGTITDFGTHRFDTVHQIMGVDVPTSVSATGQRYSLKDGGEMPDVMQVTYEYPGFVMSYEACNMSGHGLGGRTTGMRYYNARGDVDRPHGEAYYGTNGALFCDRLGYELYPDPKAEPARPRVTDPTTGTTSGVVGPSTGETRAASRRRNVTDATSAHARLFLEVVRGKQKNPADVRVGHRSTVVSHLGNIAYKTGRKLRWDGEAEQFTGDAEANKLLGREARKPYDRLT